MDEPKQCGAATNDSEHGMEKTRRQIPSTIRTHGDRNDTRAVNHSDSGAWSALATEEPTIDSAECQR